MASLFFFFFFIREPITPNKKGEGYHWAAKGLEGLEFEVFQEGLWAAPFAWQSQEGLIPGDIVAEDGALLGDL